MTKKKTEIKLPRYRNSSNYSHHPTDLETVKGESITEPGATLTIKEILERFTSGIPLPQSQVHYDERASFDTDTTFRDPDRDLSHLDDKVNQEFEEMRIKNQQDQQSDLKDDKSTSKSDKTEDQTEKRKSEADEQPKEDQS